MRNETGHLINETTREICNMYVFLNPLCIRVSFFFLHRLLYILKQTKHIKSENTLPYIHFGLDGLRQYANTVNFN